VGRDNFYYECSSYKQSVLEVTTEPKLFRVGDFQFPDLPWGRLLDRGLAYLDKNGYRSSIDALIWGREDELLESVLHDLGMLEKMPPEFEWAYTFYVLKEDDRAAALYDKISGEGVDQIPFAMIVFDDSEKLSSLLDKAVAVVSRGDDTELFPKTSQSSIACKLARWMRELKGDEAQVEHLMELAEQAADSAQDFETIAENRLVFSDDRGAVNILRKASRSIQDPFDLCLLARSWATLFAHDEEVRWLLQKAERYAVTSSDYYFIASFWNQLLRDKQEAFRLLNFAEYQAERSYEFCMLAEQWSEVFSDRRKVRRLLNVAKKHADSGNDYSKLAINWMRLLGDSGHARSCLKKAEQKSTMAIDLISVAKIWVQHLGNQRKARIALDKALGAATVDYELEWVASAWIELFGDHKKSRQIVAMIGAECVP